MPTEENVINLVNEYQGKDKTFAEFIAELLKGKFIEIYVGDSYEEISTEQVSTAYPAVFCGKVVTAYKECLVINSVFINQAKKLQIGNLMFVNERAIRALNEVDENGTIEEMFLRSRETIDILSAFKHGHK